MVFPWVQNPPEFLDISKRLFAVNPNFFYGSNEVMRNIVSASVETNDIGVHGPPSSM